MKSTKEKIQFHPHRPNRSKSRSKFSPYHTHLSNEKQSVQARQNREKMTMKEPIIKIKDLISGNATKNKLTINTDKPFYEPNLLTATNFSNCNFHSPFQTIEHSKFNDLAAKIDQQSEVIQQYFSDLNNKLKLPKLEPYDHKNEKQTQKQKQTQILILEQLKQLKNISNQSMHLRQIIASLERQAHFYREQMRKWQQEASMLHQKITSLENTIKTLEQQKKQNKDSLNQLSSKSSIKLPKDNVTKEDIKQLKFLESEKQLKNQRVLIQSLKKQVQDLKLQNQMLTQQVKLLNYSLNQRDRQVQKLKKNTSLMKETSQKRSKSKKSSIIQQMSVAQSKPENEADLQKNQPLQQPQPQQNQSQDLQINTGSRYKKLTKSFIFKPNELKEKALHNSRRSQLYKAKKRCSIDQEILSDNFLKALSLFQGPTMKKSSTSQSKYKVNHQKINAEIDKRKLKFAKSVLKIGVKNSNIGEEKVSRKRERKQFNNFSSSKLTDLQIIRKTIGARWRVLRLQYSDIQMQLIQRKSSMINQKEMAQYLQVYPFFLNIELIEEVLRYILRSDFCQQEQPQSWPSIEIDSFCNNIREFIPEFSALEEEEQVVMLEKIKNVVFQKKNSLLEELSYQQTQEGIIRQAQMRTVLQQFKFSEPQIQLMIGQCCLISLDIQHLSYEKYISFFNQVNPSAFDI